MRPTFVLLTGIAMVAPTFAAATALPPARPPKVVAVKPALPARVDFRHDIQPLLADRCLNCHGPDAAKVGAGLRLDLPEGALAARPSGKKAVVPGRPQESELIARIVATNALMMPPARSHKTLSLAEKELFKRWIAQGAEYRKHWAFERPALAAVPASTIKAQREKAGLSINPVDAFIWARLDKEGLKPAPAADRPTLIRRVTFDLTGLPPTPAEVDAFVSDRSPDAYAKVVDRLLASPRYGERMVWDWLDAARYADTNGYQGDGVRTMWPWRDWAVRAFNSDMPFDQFTVEQIAGDLLPNSTREQRLATGFHRNHMLNGEGGRIAEESRIDYVVDRVDTTATVWMGLTLGCARCHDHKYDPFTQREYYSLFAYYNNLPETGAVDRGGNANPVMLLPTPEQEKRRVELDDAIKAAQDKLNALPADSPEKGAAQKAVDDARKNRNALESSIINVMVMEERPQPRETHILIRGAYDKPGDKVTYGTPATLNPLPAESPKNRLALARWLVDPANPLTARVTVNRLWAMVFGTGLVKTAEDFGVQGERPTHPELLDFLAVTFGSPKSQVPNPRGDGAQDGSGGPKTASATVNQGLGWSQKALLRLLVTSETYKQSAKASPDLVARDPENRLHARGPRFRLSSAMLRDQALAVSGLLVEKLGGPPVKGYQPEGIWEDATFGQIKYVQEHGEALYRRSLYSFWRRIVGPTNLFDAGARQQCTVRLARTNTPLHALTLLNDVTYVEAARAFAQRVLTSGGAGDAERIQFAFRLATARRPTAGEAQLLLSRLQRLRAQYAGDEAAAKKLLSVGESKRDDRLPLGEHAAWAGLCSLILNLDEVVSKG